MCFCKIEFFPKVEINERNLVTPTPDQLNYRRVAEYRVCMHLAKH